METYFRAGPTLILVIEWVFFLLSAFFIFLPFAYLGFRKWKRKLSISWWQVILAYLTSLVTFVVCAWFGFWSATELTHNYFSNGYDLQSVIENKVFDLIPISVLGWSVLVFYCYIVLKHGKFTLKNFVISLVVALILLAVFVAIFFFVMVLGLGYASGKIL